MNVPTGLKCNTKLTSMHCKTEFGKVFMKNGAVDFCHSFNILVISKKWSHHNLPGLIYCTYYFNLILSIIYQISA